MKKIMFNDEEGLTKATLLGLKTMTRRVMSPQPVNCSIFRKATSDYKTIFPISEGVEYVNQKTGIVECEVKPKYKVGEIVAVAQRYRDADFDFEDLRDTAGWSNKMFVKAELMPHRIKILSVFVERLQDISDEDCIAEGVDLPYRMGYGFMTTPREAFAELIDKTCGKGTWSSNPWVFVYEYKLIK